MYFYVKNREEAESNNYLKEPHIIISINFPKTITEETVAKPATNEFTKEVLSLYFSDVGRLSNPYDEEAKASSRCVPFDRDMALQVIDLIERNNVEHVIIHCLGGMSRSASMADAISMFFNLEKATGWWVINDLVYVTMLNTLVEYYGDIDD